LAARCEERDVLAGELADPAASAAPERNATANSAQIRVPVVRDKM
jgi:hypothetical protein